MVSDDLFFEFAAKADAEAKAKAASKGNFTPRELEQIQYVGLQTDVPHIFRMVGGPVNSNLDNSTARTVTISWIIGDDGKKFRVCRPSPKEDPNYILNKIIMKVRAKKWSGKESTYPVKDAFPEIWNMIEKNGLTKEDRGFIYDNGWLGKSKLLLNVIDREDMAWHKQNKHTKLLAKSVTDSGFADDGIAASCAEKFTSIQRTYGSWEKYDLEIVRHPTKENTYEIFNVSRTPEVAPANLQKFIVTAPLTEEEDSWERYDLSKIYHTTSATKIYNRLKGQIARIDAALNTRFLTELEGLVEKERIEREANQEAAEDAPMTEATQPVAESNFYDDEEEPMAAPTRPQPAVRQRVAPSVAITRAPYLDLPFSDAVPEEYRDKIARVTKGANPSTPKHYDIEWVDVPFADLVSCTNPECKSVTPLTFTQCPCCGEQY